MSYDGHLDDVPVALPALLVADEGDPELVEDGGDVGPVVGLAPAHRPQRGVAQLRLLEPAGRQTRRLDVVWVKGVQKSGILSHEPSRRFHGEGPYLGLLLVEALTSAFTFKTLCQTGA